MNPLITAEDLVAVLLRVGGIIDPDAVRDPEGYDSGVTLASIHEAAAILDKEARRVAKTSDLETLLKDLDRYFGESCTHPLAVRLRDPVRAWDEDSLENTEGQASPDDHA